MPFSGGVTRQLSAQRSVDGETSFTGALSTTTTIEKLVEGVLTFSGYLGLRAPIRRISVEGVISFWGTLTSSGGVATVSGLFKSLFKGSLFNGGLFRK